MAVILFAEDHPDTCTVVAKYLRLKGHRVTCAANGREVIDALAVEVPDVILLDLMMPVMNGLECLEAVRSYIRWQTIPVIVASAGDVALLDRATAMGVATVLRKPFVFPELLAAIDAATAKQPG